MAVAELFADQGDASELAGSRWANAGAVAIAELDVLAEHARRCRRQPAADVAHAGHSGSGSTVMLKPEDLSVDTIPKRRTSELILCLSPGMIEFFWKEAGTSIDSEHATKVRRLIAAEIDRRVPVPT